MQARSGAVETEGSALLLALEDEEVERVVVKGVEGGGEEALELLELDGLLELAAEDDWEDEVVVVAVKGVDGGGEEASELLELDRLGELAVEDDWADEVVVVVVMKMVCGTSASSLAAGIRSPPR